MTRASGAERYLNRTFDGMWELFAEGQGPEPPPNAAFREYPRADRAALPPARSERSSGWTARTLADFLWLGFGLHHIELGPSSGWPYHRTAPSARCLYPTEVYLWTRECGDLAGGLYHYDSPHHALDFLGPVPCGRLEAALGRRLDDVVALLFVAGFFRRTAARYREYAYRLCAQEAGMTLGALTLGAVFHRLRPAILYRFLDQDIRQLLQLTEDAQSPLAVVVLSMSSGREILTPLGRPVFAVAGPSSVRDEPYCPEAVALDVDSRIDRIDDAGPIEAGRVPASLGGRSAIVQRQSGPPNFQPTAESLPLSDLRWILANAGRPPTEGPVPLSVFAVANRVTGLAAGVYRHGADGLQAIREGELGRAVQRLTRSTNINAAAAPAVLYICADARPYLRRFGDRGYRIMNLASGVLAQELSVAATARGWVPRVSNGYDTPGVRELLGLPSAWHFPVFQIFLAKLRPGARYRLPLGGC